MVERRLVKGRVWDEFALGVIVSLGMSLLMALLWIADASPGLYAPFKYTVPK